MTTLPSKLPSDAHRDNEGNFKQCRVHAMIIAALSFCCRSLILLIPLHQTHFRPVLRSSKISNQPLKQHHIHSNGFKRLSCAYNVISKIVSPLYSSRQYPPPTLTLNLLLSRSRAKPIQNQTISHKQFHTTTTIATHINPNQSIN